MFEKLRRKLIISNLLVISIVLILAFSVIYLVIGYNVYNQNKLKLENIQANTLRFLELKDQMIAVKGDDLNINQIESFGIIFSDNDQILFESTYGLLDNQKLISIIETVENKQQQSGRIKIDDDWYMYLYNRAMAKVNVSGENTPEIENIDQISLLNITQPNTLMLHILLAFIISGLIIFVFLLYISIRFADLAIGPIEISYNKQKQFIQDASHELKTPITAISANLDMLSSNQNETVASQMKWLDNIDFEIQRMSKLVGDLLFLAKSEFDQNGLELSDVDLICVINNCVTVIEAVAFEKNIKIEQHLLDKAIIQSNDDKLTQLISILLDNALKYTNINGYIRINMQQNNSHYILKIINTGMGIDERHLPYIFDRFYRVDKARTSDGSYGLGLPIAKNIAEMLAIEISVSSVLNEKTIFKLLIKKG